MSFISKHDKPIRKKDFHKEPTESDWALYKGIAQENGIGYYTFQTRVRSGMSPKKAASTPRKQITNCHVWVGDVLDTRKGHCDALGLSYGTVCGYMTKYRLGFEDAVKLRLLRQSGDIV